MKIRWRLAFVLTLFFSGNCNILNTYDQSQIALSFDVLYPENLSTQVIRLARHVWSDCIHLSDQKQQSDEQIVRDIMALYLAFGSLKESKNYYDQDLYYIADLLIMLNKQYIIEMEDDDSMNTVVTLFNRCLQQVVDCVLEHDFKL